MTGYLILTWIAVAVAIVAVIAAVALYWRTLQIMRSMDRMIDMALAGNFREKDFSEGRLSRLEAKTRQYLMKGNNVQRQAERDRENLKTTISNLSHQTKTPIANILLYIQLLAEKETLNGEARQLLSQIEGQAEKLNFLIASLVKMSRLESDIISLTPAKNHVEELARSLYEAFAPRAEQEGKSLTLDLHGGSSVLGTGEDSCEERSCARNGNERMRGDRGEGQWDENELPENGGAENARSDSMETAEVFDSRWTMEAMENIMDNALKYTPVGGHICISVMHYKMFARIDIADDGMGIREEESAKIFSRFYRSQEAAQSEGVGIGLYLAREIISRENGYIRVRSNHGRGSTFSVLLPKADELIQADAHHKEFC